MLGPTYHTEIWQPGILHASAASILARVDRTAIPVTWLPAQAPFRFLADPFGLWRDGDLHVFCEAFDYRSKKGHIHYYVYGPDYSLRREGVALRAAHHLSYPFVFAHDGEIYLLPEAHRSGALTLYRARRFPDDWEAIHTFPFPAVDATLLFRDGRWWMFFTLPGERAFHELHVATAGTLAGPWRMHPGNPVRDARDSARPGGTPFVANGKTYLPTQNCVAGYGSSIRFLEVRLGDGDCRFEVAGDLTPAEIGGAPRLFGQFEGLHTFAACGDATLIDAKRIDRSARRGLINLTRRLRRIAFWRGDS